MRRDLSPEARGAALVLVCLLRARAARMAGEDARAQAWAILGVAAICWWPGWWLWWWAWKEAGGE